METVIIYSSDYLSLSGDFLEEIIFKLIISETSFGVIFGVG